MFHKDIPNLNLVSNFLPQLLRFWYIAFQNFIHFEKEEVGNFYHSFKSVSGNGMLLLDFS